MHNVLDNCYQQFQLCRKCINNRTHAYSIFRRDNINILPTIDEKVQICYKLQNRNERATIIIEAGTFCIMTAEVDLFIIFPK